MPGSDEGGVGRVQLSEPDWPGPPASTTAEASPSSTSSVPSATAGPDRGGRPPPPTLDMACCSGSLRARSAQGRESVTAEVKGTVPHFEVVEYISNVCENVQLVMSISFVPF